MTALAISSGFPRYTDTVGKALEGKIYFGLPNQNPITAPKVVYWDQALTQPASQPLLVSGGYIMRAGTPAGLFTDGDYSILAQDKTGATAFYAASSSQFDNYLAVLNSLSVIGNLGNTSNMAYGVALIGGAGRVVPTIAVLRTLPKTGSPEAFVTGYYAQGDGGGGAYYYDALDTTSTDNGGSVIVAADGGRWKLVHGGTLRLRQFGAKGDDSNDDTAFINNWFAAVLSTGCEGYADPGTYKVTVPITFDYVSKKTYGFTIKGAGVQRTIFKSYISSGTYAFGLIASGGSVGSPVTAYYPKISQIGFYANFPGTTFMVGNRDLSDQQNLVRLEIWYGNSSDSASANGVEINSCYESKFEMNGGLGTTAAQGDNLRLRMCSFSKFWVSMGSTASAGVVTGTAVGVHLTNAFNYGNVFTAPDLEVLYTCVKIDSSASQDNTFVGGTYADIGQYAVIATAGDNNQFIGGNINGGPTYQAFFAHGANAVGVSAQRSPNKIQTFAPASGGTVVIANDTTFAKLTIGATIASCTIQLPPNPWDGMQVRIQTTQPVTSLTLQGGSGSGDNILDAVGTLTAGQGICYHYSAYNNYWFRVY